jgi:superfamily I DNA/RNA helicase
MKARDIPDFKTKLKKWARSEIERAQRVDRRGMIRSTMDQCDTIRVLLAGAHSLPVMFDRIDDLFGDPAANYVKCSSVHKAKGLESERVFLLKDTLYPWWGQDKQEERNIEYVAVTRAKHDLTWVTGFNPKSSGDGPNYIQRWFDDWDFEDGGDGEDLPDHVVQALD